MYSRDGKEITNDFSTGLMVASIALDRSDRWREAIGGPDERDGHRQWRVVRQHGTYNLRLTAGEDAELSSRERTG